MSTILAGMCTVVTWITGIVILTGLAVVIYALITSEMDPS